MRFCEIRRFIFHHKKHPSTLGAPEITAFLSWLAIGQRVGSSTQNQALSALLFLYRHVLYIEIGAIDQMPRAKLPHRIPVVLGREEVGTIFKHIQGTMWMVVALLYEAGLRLQECLELRVKDLDFDRHEIVVRRGKGQKDRRTMLPVAIEERLQGQEYMRWLIPPLLEMGFSVVVPQGPDSPTSPSPRSTNRETRRIQAGRCVLRWTVAHAIEYGFDVSRLIVAGVSLGGHTALMSGLITSRDGFDQACPGEAEPKIAAVVDFFGPIRLPDGTEGDSPRIRPLTYVRKDQPPILVIHGDADPTVPYAHSVDLNNALDRVGASHAFLRIPGGKHGLVTWEPDQLKLVWLTVSDFLRSHGLLPDGSVK